MSDYEFSPKDVEELNKKLIVARYIRYNGKDDVFIKGLLSDVLDWVVESHPDEEEQVYPDPEEFVKVKFG